MAVQNLAMTRMKDFRRILKKAGVDGYLTTSALEQRYVSGIELSDGEAVFLITTQSAYCITKKLIVSKMAPAAKFLKTQDVPYGSMLQGALDKIKKMELAKVAFDPSLVGFETGETLVKAGLVRAPGLLGNLRCQKYPDEITRLRKACKIAWEAFEEVKPQIKTGMTEEDVRILMAVAMTRRGADSVPFNIVCFGENTADAHHTPSKTRKLKNNEAVLMDFGCFYEGYTSDMTRSWWHGKNEPALYTRVWKMVEQAYRAGVKALRPGISSGDADKAVRDVIEAAGYGKEFFHATGHGIGLVVHENPVLRAATAQPVSENAVVTIEPGIYFAGKWGIRLEDSFLVTRKGAKKLTQK